MSASLWAHLFDGLPSAFTSTLLAQIDQVSQTAGYDVKNAAAQLAADIRASKSSQPIPQGPPTQPQVPGTFNLNQPLSLVVSPADIAAAQARLKAGDPWTTNHYQTLMTFAAQAPALSQISSHMMYTPDISDLLAKQGIALATRWRFQGAPSDNDFNTAKAILMSFTNGFLSDQTPLAANSGLDFSSSVPSFVYLFELLYPGMTPADGQQVANGFSLIAEQIQLNLYGGPNDPNVSSREERMVSSTFCTWQRTPALLMSALASGSDGFGAGGFGSPDPSYSRRRDFIFICARPLVRTIFSRKHPRGIISSMTAFPWRWRHRRCNIKNHAAIPNVPDLAGYQNNRIEQVFLTMIQYARGDLTDPVTGDGGSNNIRQDVPVYAFANSLYGGNPAFGWVMEMEQSMSFRSWTVVDEAKVLFSVPGSQAEPAPAKPLQNGSGAIGMRQNPDLLNPGTSTGFQAQDHTESHQSANNLAVEAWYNGVNLSVASHPGSSADNGPMNDNYWRGRAANIVQFDRNVPLGFASFDESGANSRFTFVLEPQSAGASIHVAKASMVGGYIKNGSERTTRGVIQATDGPGGQAGYRFIPVRAWTRRPVRARKLSDPSGMVR